jgi:alginate O-acetyltransferase complex protein AlgI
MVFSTFEFLFFFLPITLLIYYLIPSRMRNAVLLVMSLLFYAWGEPKYILIMLFSTVFDYCNGRLLERFDSRERLRKLILIISVTVNLGILCFFKYTDFLIETVNDVASLSLPVLKQALPIGISFYTFQTLSYTIDVYRRRVAVQHNILDFGMYICLFPQLIAGPIVRYADIESEIKNRSVNVGDVWSGLLRFTVGLGKKVLLGNQIGALWEEISSSYTSLPALSAWLGALAFAFQIYFDFSGYSDMAIGLGHMFGFSFPENFNYPYQAESITDFWRRWHMTLSTWFREYLYIPLGGNRKGILMQIRNLFFVWLLTGLWHGAGWNFVLWGLYYFVLLTAEKLFMLKFLKKAPRFARHIYTVLLVLFGWVLFACDDLSMLKGYIGAMLGFGSGAASSMSVYYLITYAILFIVSIIGSTELPRRFIIKCANRASLSVKATFAVEAVFIILILGLSIVFIAADSYNPFLYFRF